MIVLKDMSRTRILPLLALHGRWLDKHDGPWKVVPNYFSAGITAKSDDKGTDVEYLFGPSWAVVGRQFFATIGGYAGQQQRVLVSNLTQDVSYTDATLPVAKARFRILCKLSSSEWYLVGRGTHKIVSLESVTGPLITGKTEIIPQGKGTSKM
jgi:hypothetical protein